MQALTGRGFEEDPREIARRYVWRAWAFARTKEFDVAADALRKAVRKYRQAKQRELRRR